MSQPRSWSFKLLISFLRVDPQFRFDLSSSNLGSTARANSIYWLEKKVSSTFMLVHMGFTFTPLVLLPDQFFSGFLALTLPVKISLRTWFLL